MQDVFYYLDGKTKLPLEAYTWDDKLSNFSFPLTRLD